MTMTNGRQRALFLALLCLCSPRHAASGEGIFLEENGAPFFVDLAGPAARTGDSIPGLQFMAWRRVSIRGQEGKIRMGLGYGRGLRPFADRSFEEVGRDANMTLREFEDLDGFWGPSMDGFQEEAFFQLTAEDIGHLQEFLARLEQVAWRRPPDHVRNRFLQADWGDLKLRRDDGGFYVYTAGSKSWEPLPVLRFQAALKAAVRDLRRLMSEGPSVDL